MFELVVMPIIELWSDENSKPEELQAQLKELQEALSEQVNEKVEWTEEIDDAAMFEADGVDGFALYALRAVAAWLEINDDLEGFELGEEPWEHAAFVALEKHGEVKKFAQVLHSDEADYTAFLPANLPDVFVMLEEGQEEDDEEMATMAVGSLFALRKELDTLREGLGLEAGLEDHIDDVVFDPSVDPLAAPRYCWVVWSARCNEALERKLPLMLVYEDFDFGEQEGEEEPVH